MKEGLDFGQALAWLREGDRVMRAGWNGKGMFLFLVHSGGWSFDSVNGEGYPTAGFIAMKTADGKIVPWLASQTDVLATDWAVL